MPGPLVCATSLRASATADHALALAEVHGGRLELVHVAPAAPALGYGVERDEAEASHRLREAIVEDHLARRRHLADRTAGAALRPGTMVLEGHPARAILGAAQALDAPAIVVGGGRARETDLAAAALGPVPVTILHRASRAVLVAGTRTPSGGDWLLCVGPDDDPATLVRAAQRTLGVAPAAVLAALRLDRPGDGSRAAAARLAEAWADAIGARVGPGIAVEVQVAEPVGALVAAAQRPTIAGLVVGRGGGMGSIGLAVLQRVRVPVLFLSWEDT